MTLQSAACGLALHDLPQVGRVHLATNRIDVEVLLGGAKGQRGKGQEKRGPYSPLSPTMDGAASRFASRRASSEWAFA